MPDFAAAYDTILTQFKAQMDSRRPKVPVAWPGIDFDPDTGFAAATHQGWCRITILGADTVQASAGGPGKRRWRVWGQVTVQVFTPTKSGVLTAMEIADDVATSLRGVVASDVTLLASTVRPIGQDEQGWFQVNVDTPFRFDMLETRSDIDYAEDSTSEQGTWGNPARFGDAYVWYDDTNDVMRIKTDSAPTSETDGVALVTGGLA